MGYPEQDSFCAPVPAVGTHLGVDWTAAHLDSLELVFKHVLLHARPVTAGMVPTERSLWFVLFSVCTESQVNYTV